MPLVSPSWLAAHLDDPDLRIVDVRWYLADVLQGSREYEISHIPEAIYLDIENDLSAPAGPGRHPLPDWSTFATLLGRRGIGSSHRVVAYDSFDGSIAARLWWMLRHLGHKRVSVLDGGFEAWTRCGGPTTSSKPDFEAAPFDVRIRRGDTVDREELLSLLGTVPLLDARAPER
jgi:thiosulfate/3-mercaptopyruvate sulfurtransferase